MDSYVRCAVRTCSNNSRKTGNKIRYFRFPRDDDLLTLWTVRCDRLDTWTPSTSFVCSSHFTADDYAVVTPGISRLHEEAIPSRNLGYDWDSEDRTNVMMEEDFTSEDDDNNDSIARALMSMSERARSHEAPPIHVVGFPMAGTTESTSVVSTCTITSSQPVLTQALPYKSVEMRRPDDPNVIVITDVRKKLKPVKKIEPTEPRRKWKKVFCCVPTCSAWKGKERSVRVGFHYLPRELNERAKWILAIFKENLYCKRSRFICRRHFTTDDYLEKKGGDLPRLRKGAIPSQNIPICRAEALLARKKLWLDCTRRKPYYKHLTFVEQLEQEPELQELFEKYVDEASKIDPQRGEVVPNIPRRADLKGCGEPVQGTGIIPEKPKKKRTKKIKSFDEMNDEEKAKFLTMKAEIEEKRKELSKLRGIKRRRKMKQLNEEGKMKLFEEKLKRLELRRNNPEAYHELMAEERSMQRKEVKAMKTAVGAPARILVNSKDNVKTSTKRLEIKECDPEAYSKSLTEERALQRRTELAKRITSAAFTKNPVNFSNKIEIIANDPENGAKYKVIVKKVLKSKKDLTKDSVTQLAKDKSKSMEIVKTIIRDIDFEKAKRFKFPQTAKLTKISQLRSSGIDVQRLEQVQSPGVKDEGASSSAGGPAVVVEPMISGDDLRPEDLVEQPQGLDEQPASPADDHHSDDEHFGDEHRLDNCSEEEENLFEDATDGFDHSYTNKTTDLIEGPQPSDPFEELRQQLQSLPENEARALVKEKMDGYKDTFKKQMTRIRALIQSKKKVDRKVKMLTRTLCLSLRDQYVKYYKN